MATVSADMNEFLRKDVYEADQRALITEIRLGNAEILKKIEQLDTKLSNRIDQVESSLNNKIDNVEASLNARIDKVETTLNARIDKLEIEIDGKIAQVKARIDNVETKLEATNMRLTDLNVRMGETHSIMGWGIGIMVAVIAFLLVISPVGVFLKNLFRPSVTLEQIDELITAKVDALVAARLGVR